MEQPRRTGAYVLALLLLVSIVWAYWQPFGEMALKWTTDPQYQQGYLVPLFAAFLVWRRRDELAKDECQPNWLGLVPLLVGLVMRLGGAALYVDWVEAVSLLPFLWGATLLLGGWHALRHTWYAVAFLFFMIPLPYGVETALSQPLQRVATVASTFTLQSLGFAAFNEGNVIVLNQERIGIIEACNGLGMLMLFFAMAVGIGIDVLQRDRRGRRNWVDLLVITASAVPIAVVANMVRIVVTVILRDKAGAYWSDLVFHDLGGLLMMPIALLLLWLVVLAVDFVFEDVEEGEEVPFDLGGFAPVGHPES